MNNKKDYNKPTITVHGNITKITKKGLIDDDGVEPTS
jgi:hypothetical protein